MTSSHDLILEVQQLTDAMFDGRIDAIGTSRLNALLAGDPVLLQTYVERTNFHADVHNQTGPQTDEYQVARVLRTFADNWESSTEKHRRRDRLLYTSSAVLLIGLIGWGMFSLTNFWTRPVGIVAQLSSDVVSNRAPVELGKVIRLNDTISIKEGIVSLQFEHVLVDLIGPTEVKIQGNHLIQLLQGQLTAKIVPGGEGFTVRTSDAKIVDLGTEFLVKYDTELGTDVSVRRGRTQLSLLDWRGQSTTHQELTAHRAVRLSQREKTVKEVSFQPETFQAVEENRGGIRSLDGNVRTAGHPIRSFRAGRTRTPNHLLIIPEQQNVMLEEDLNLKGTHGQVRIPAGSIVSSYLVHFDPSDSGKIAPRGGVTFFGCIAAIVVSADQLAATDEKFGQPQTFYESNSFRELELDEDEIHVSDDRKTASFYFGTSPPEYLDQARIFVVSDPF